MAKELSQRKFLVGLRMNERYTALAGTFPEHKYPQTKSVSVKPRTHAVCGLMTTERRVGR